MIERLSDQPGFLSIAAHRIGDARFEIVSRRRLDTRQVVPFFADGATVHVGVLERIRASRHVRGAAELGLEPIGFDFRGVDETGDVRAYGRAVFSARARVDIDERALVMPLPSVARSIGWSTELAMPLLLPVHPPAHREHEVSWDGGTHRIVFRPIDELRARLRDVPHDEVLALALESLAPAPPRAWSGPDATHLLARAWDHGRIAAAVQAPLPELGERTVGLAGRDLRFLRIDRVSDIEVVTPGSGASVAVLPWVVVGGEPWFLLWVETRASALERRARQPIFDLPVHPRHVNATARYVDPSELRRDARALAEEVLTTTFRAPIRVLSAEDLGTAEPAPSFGNEVRRRLACAIDPSIVALPDDVVLVSGRELARAVAAGVVRDPVIVAGLLQLGLDPFGAVRAGEPRARRAFVDRMTEGSTVQRRLSTYSSIEAEQLSAPTYARVMLLLQHEYGVRIAYPEKEEDRSFFKAAFRVFMAAPRGDENRALQGLHWSHDAFHFALGNLTLPSFAEFDEWFDSGAKLPPPAPHEGAAFDGYVAALKGAEDEATFFSFWTLYEEQPSLVRHVSMLTFWAALRELGIVDRASARAVYDDLAVRAVLPTRIAEHPLYAARPDLQKLFEYIRGFRDYHHKDIHPAFDHASRDVYRGYFLRLGIYQSDPARYLDGVHSFDARLRALPPGLSPLAALAADVRVAIALRVFDVTKSMRLQRTAIAKLALGEDDRLGGRECRRATCTPAEQRTRRAMVRLAAESRIQQLEALNQRLQTLRSEVHDAELSPHNEHTFTALGALGAEVESLRTRIWDDAAPLLAPDVLAEERTRELPR